MFNYQPVISPDLIYHRSGWKDVIEALQSMSTTEPTGLKMIDLVDNYYANPKNSYINSPWIGFIHHVPNVPESESPNLDGLLNNYKFKRDLFYCRGVLTLSNYLKTYLETKLPKVKITRVFHPISENFDKFDINLFSQNKNKQIVFIGNQDRQYKRFYQLDLSLPTLTLNYQKTWLSGKYIEKSLELIKRQLSKEPYLNFTLEGLSRIKIDNLSNKEYDNVLKQNIVMLDLYNCSANNTIIECIVRNTPIFVNKTGGVAEYLGDSYPLYFDSLEELTRKLGDISLILEAHLYLKSMDKSFLSFEHFKKQIELIVHEIKPSNKPKNLSINISTPVSRPTIIPKPISKPHKKSTIINLNNYNLHQKQVKTNRADKII